MPKPRVVLGIPTQGWIHHVLAIRLPTLCRHPDYEVLFVTLNERPIEHARNHLVKIALGMQAQWLLMVDSDNPPIRNPLDLIALDKDIIACPTPMYKRILNTANVCWNTGMDTPEGKSRIDGVHQGDTCEQRDLVGTGCILIRRNVLEAVRPAFMRDWDADGLSFVTSDFTFCRRARAQGFKVWVHFGYPCRHFSEIELTELTPLDLSKVENNMETFEHEPTLKDTPKQ